jgi:hypothetical protein
MERDRYSRKYGNNTESSYLYQNKYNNLPKNTPRAIGGHGHKSRNAGGCGCGKERVYIWYALTRLGTYWQGQQNASNQNNYQKAQQDQLRRIKFYSSFH